MPSPDVSAATWSIRAGVAFAVVRFSVGAIFNLLIVGTPGTGVIADAAWWASGAAAISAGIVGGVLFWRVRRQHTTKSQGALVGVIAAVGSYVGIGLLALLVASFDVVNTGKGIHFIFWAVLMSVVFGAGSGLSTGAMVFPSLAVLGASLSTMNPANTRRDKK